MATSSAPRLPSVELVALPFLLLLSGAAGLSYEVVWLRSLANVIGCSTTATATILSVFMGGMALGSLVLGPVADRVRQPLKLYALLELILAGVAVLLPQLLGLVERIDVDLSTAMGGSSGLVSRSIAAGLVLLLPTFVMGGTLPAIARHLARYEARSGAFFNIVYGVHVLGAAGGALAASFVLIPRLGLSLTSAMGATVNVSVALGVTWLASRTQQQPTRLVEPNPTLHAAVIPAGTAIAPRALYATAFLSGLVLLGSEVVFVRALVMALSAKVHSFALMLSVFLVGLSIGSLIAGQLGRRLASAPATLGVALLLGAIGVLVSREVLGRMPLPTLLAAYDGGVSSREYVALSLKLSALSLLPVTIPLGMVLPLVLRNVMTPTASAGHIVGRVLFVNTVGSIVGPLLAPYVLIRWLGLFGTLHVTAITVAVMGVLWCLPALVGKRGLKPFLLAAPVVAATVVAFALVRPQWFGTPVLDCTLFGEYRVQGKREPPNILEYREAETCTVTIYQGDGGRRFIRIDGFEAAGAPGPRDQHYLYMRFMAHLPVMLHSTGPVRDALVICCGTGTTAGALSLYPLSRLELVDLHPEVLASLHWFADTNHRLQDNVNCRKIAEDGRAHLRRRHDEYDVITLEPMPPQHAGMTQLYSVEFYESCARALREDGVICQWLPYHLVTREQACAVTRAMADVFRCVQVWDYKTTGILIGSKRRELPIDRASFEAALANPEVRRDFELGGVEQPFDLADCFVCQADSLRQVLDRVAPVHDDRPSLEYEVVSYGLSQPSKQELARIREPFYLARTRSSLPLRGFADSERASLEREWRGAGVGRFAVYLEKTQNADVARAFLNDQIARHPELKESTSLQRGAKHLLAR